MADGALFYPPRAQFLDANGDPVSGGKAYFYEPGTSTPKDVYQDEALTTPHANPVILSTLGAAEIWMDGLYKMNLLTSDDVQVPGYPVDNVSSAPAATADTEASEWLSPADVPTYLSATQFTVPNDKRTTYQEGRRLKCTVTAGTVYCLVTNVSFAASTTTVTVSGGSLDSGLSVVDVGILTATNPSIPKVALEVEDATSLIHAVSAQQISSGELTYIAESGAQDVYVMTLVPAITAYTDGMKLSCQMGAYANSSTTPTLNVNGLGAKTIKRLDGSALLVGDLPSGWRARFEYDGTDMLLLNPALYETWLRDNNRYALDTGSANAYAIAPSPAVDAYRTGLSVVFKVVNANTLATPTLIVNGLAEGAKTIAKLDSSGTLVGLGIDLPAGHWAECVYDGTYFVLKNPATNVRPVAIKVVEIVHNIAVASTWETVAASAEIFIPDDITALTCKFRMKGSIISNKQMRIGINGTYGTATTADTNTTYTTYTVSIDVDSDDKGAWQALEIQAFAVNDTNDVTIHKDEESIAGIQTDFIGASYFS